MTVFGKWFFSWLSWRDFWPHQLYAKVSFLNWNKKSTCIWKWDVSFSPTIPLRAKHHFLEHYPDLIEMFGCLMRVNTLGCESKHRFLKNTALAKKNFKNVSKLLAEEHQLAQSATVENLTCNFLVLEDVTPLVRMSTAIKQSAISFFREECLSSLTCCHKVRFHGTWYRKGELVAINQTLYKFCLIEVLFVQGRNCYAVGEPFFYCFSGPSPTSICFFLLKIPCVPLLTLLDLMTTFPIPSI